MKRELYKHIALTIDAYLRCGREGKTDWQNRHEARVIELQAYLPSGSGIDAGTTVDLDSTTGYKLVLHSSYHVMNEAGFYVRWIYFTVTVKPSLMHDIALTIRGNFGKEQDIKEYLYELFEAYLTERGYY